ncbi:MAG: 4Fe-4S binding protein [Desulfatibacillum sp.]|nr:4Fe-4S binding protein [Desulfatibacillum sp.]
MLAGIQNFKRQFDHVAKHRKKYRSLQKHLNSMPVGFPRTISGVEMRILRSIYTPAEAVAALALSYRLESVAAIEARARKKSLPTENLETLLHSMEKKGALFAKEEGGEWLFGLVPIIIGFFEMQVKFLTAGMYLDTRQYMIEGMAAEYLTTAVHQMRVIPVEKSVTPENRISTYDEIRALLNRADGKISVAECICRKGHDLIGEPCKKTNRRETCLGLHDFHDTYVRNGWARSITLEEAMEIVGQCEKEGLVIQPSNEKEPNFVCMCCSCCCGILEMLGAMPRPADFVATNHMTVLDQELCNGCGKCVKRCQTNAIHIEDKMAILDTGRCIGCGLCVSTCKPGALSLMTKPVKLPLPEDLQDLMDTIQQGKKSALGRLSMAVKGLAGIKV